MNSSEAVVTRAEGGAHELEVQAAAAPVERAVYKKASAPGSEDTAAIYAGTALTLTDKYIITFRGRIATFISATVLLFRVSSTADDNNHFAISLSTAGANISCVPARVDAGSRTTLTLDSGATSYTPSGGVTDYYEYKLQVNGNVFTMFAEGTEIWQATHANHSSNTGFGFACGEANVYSLTDLDVQTATVPITRREQKLVATSAGNIYSGNKADGLTLASGTQPAVATSGVVRSATTVQKVFFCDATTSGYKVLDVTTNAVSGWQAGVTAGSLPSGGTGVANAITAVDTGAKTFTVAEDLSSLSANDFVEIRDSGTDNDGSYTVASTSGTGPTVITVNESIQSATVAGDLYVSDVGCYIIAIYRGRVVMAGLRTDPTNWFMSAVGDAFNWDYFPATISATQAVAGTIAEAKKSGDVITCLAPFQDDLLIIGGANSLWIMRSDPADGGAIDKVPIQVGVTGPEAWTFNNTGMFYFFSVNGLYRMPAGGGVPELVSANRLDKTFGDIDVSTQHIILDYDPKRQGVHVFISPDAQPSTATTHYFYDERNDAFWPEQLPAAQGPIASHYFNSDNPESSGLLLFGYDSVIREFNDAATDDDGTVISSHCRFTPITPGDILASSRVSEVAIVMADSSDDVTYKMFTGDTPEQAEANADAGTARVKRTLKAGRNNSIRQRVSQNSFIIELSQAGTSAARWAYERGLAVAAVVARMRGKGV
jgi:hypothetical protein